MDIKNPLKQPNLLSFIDHTLQILFVIRTISLTVSIKNLFFWQSR